MQTGLPLSAPLAQARRAALASLPSPNSLVLFAQVVTRGLESVRLVLRWLEMRPQGQPAAAGMQARTPTSLLFPSITLLIASLRRPTGANSLVLRVPRSPRAFPVPMRHPELGTALRTPLPGAQMGDLNAVF